MRIVLDGMGGDNAPQDIVKGAIDALDFIVDDIIIVGDTETIQRELSKHQYDTSRISIRHAEEVIDNDEPPVKAVRTKKNSSIVVGLRMIKDGEGDLFVSAGSTGAVLAGSLFNIGRIQGIDRPTLATIYPVLGGEPSLMADAGANPECKPVNLLEFAMMGSIYMEKVLGRKNPTVGLVNLGTEESKGTTLTKMAHELLEKCQLNFIGNVEAREIPQGACDVIVCDGFTGNVILKLTEGLALNIWNVLKNALTETSKSKFGALMLKPQLKKLKNEFDYTEYGGAPILGVKGPVVKMHGSSNANAVKNTIIKAVPFAKEGVVDIIQESVLEIEEIVTEEDQ